MSELVDGNLTDLALLVRVVESGGFTAASRVTGVPQATISRRIALLEKALALRLLDRTTRRVALTEPGRRVFDHARAMLDQAEAAQAAIADLKGEPSGELSVVAPIILGQAFVGPIVARFMAQYPRITVTLEWTTRIVNPIEDGIDVVVRVGRPVESSAILTRLGNTQVHVYAPPSFDRAVNQPRDLSDHRVVALGRTLEETALVFRKGEMMETVTAKYTMVANDSRPLIQVAEATAALALLPRFAAPTGWTECLTDWHLPKLELNTLSAPTRGSLPKIKLFLNALRNGVQDKRDMHSHLV